MNEHFLVKFMRVARDITGSERGFAVDNDLNVLDTINLTDELMAAQRFSEVATKNLRKAMESGQAILTNNIITDPSQAPVTNTNFSDLRVVVVIPVAGLGAVYLDQHIRHGIPHQNVIDRLAQVAAHIMEHGMQAYSEAEMIGLYRDL